MKDYYSSLTKPSNTSSDKGSEKKGSDFAIDILKKNIPIMSVAFSSFLCFSDYYLLNDLFGFSTAFFKDFYLSSINVISLDFFLLVALIPFVLATLILGIPVIVVETYGVEKFKEDEINYDLLITFLFVFFIVAVAFSFIIDEILSVPILATIMNLPFVDFILILIWIIVSLYIALGAEHFLQRPRMTIISQIILHISIVFLLLVLFRCIQEKIVLIYLSLLLLFEPYIMYLYLEYQKVKKSNTLKNKNPKLVPLSIVTIVIAIMFLITGAKDEWRDLNSSDSLNDITCNLLLNKIYLFDNKKMVDIDIKGFERSDRCLSKLRGDSFTLDNNGTKVIFLSDANRLYFKPMDENLTCVYAVNKIQYKGKEKYSLFDVGKLVKE